MILQFIVIIIFAGIILGFELYIFADNELETKLFHSHMRILHTMDILLPTIFLTLISVFILVSFITVYAILYLSHKIAGPLHKFENVTKELGAGNLKVNVKLRKKDELIRLQNAFEDMVVHLQDKIQGFKNNFEGMRNIETKLLEALKTASLTDGEKNELIVTFGSLLADYDKHVGEFTLKESEADTE